MLGDALAQLERDAVRMVDEEANEIASDDLGEQDLDIRLHLCQAGLDLGLDLAHVTSFFNKKAGSSPASQSGLPAAKSLSVQLSSATRPCARGLCRSGSRAAWGASSPRAGAACAPRRPGRAAAASGRD